MLATAALVAQLEPLERSPLAAAVVLLATHLVLVLRAKSSSLSSRRKEQT
jgi:hypothetical protein